MKIAIVGGGAAGFFAAIRAAELDRKASVTLFESGSQFLSKVRISGGGRCNVTHNCREAAALIDAYPRGGRELRGAFSRFAAADTVKWFESRGVGLKAEADGRMFPLTDDSATIVDCLRRAAADAGVELVKATKVKKVTRRDGRFVLATSSARDSEVAADRLLLATGGTKSAYALASSFGHRIVDPVPSLFTFEIDDSRLAGLSGLSVPNAALTLDCGDSKFKQQGPLLITHWGLSGPAVLKLSAWAARALFRDDYRAVLSINWLGRSEEELRPALLEARSRFASALVKNRCPFELPQRLWQRLLFAAGVGDETIWSQFSNKMVSELLRELTAGCYRVGGKGVFKEEFVTCGGVALDGVDFKSMESKIEQGLFFAGEILDIDAITGGFNFQAAWTTGWIAGGSLGGARVV